MLLTTNRFNKTYIHWILPSSKINTDLRKNKALGVIFYTNKQNLLSEFGQKNEEFDAALET